MSEPLVSVIMPVYNGADFLLSAVNNVLHNGYDPVELLLINDGSEDATGAIARQLPSPVRYFEQPNAGPAAARNRVLPEVNGKYVTFLDVDDRWPFGRIQQHVDYLEQHPDAQIVQGLVEKRQISYSAEGEQVEQPKPMLRPYQFVNLGAATFRRDLFFETVGVFDETMRFNEDTDWFFRAWELGVSKHVLPHVALYYRIHRSNMTHEFDALPGQGLPRLFQRHIKRLREGKIGGLAGTAGELAGYIGWLDLGQAVSEAETQESSS